jgi:polyhydroxybutyrate depolymerase
VVGGRARAWHVKVPTAAREGHALPLVVALHGGGGTGQRMHQLTGFDATAEKYGFFLVYPEGIEKNWNDGRADMRSTAAREEVPDVDFVRTILNEMRTTYLVDDARVYVTGMSNGAMMSSRIACELADRVAAVALVAGTMPRSIQPQCAPQRPVSVMVVHGTEDPIVPYQGGEVKLRGFGARGMVISANATASEWARLDGCEPGATERAIADTDTMDGSTIRVQAWSRCKEGTGVELWTVQGGGHTWPGGWQYLNEKIIGTTNRDIDGREEIWRFFAAHPRSAANSAAPPASAPP